MFQDDEINVRQKSIVLENIDDLIGYTGADFLKIGLFPYKSERKCALFKKNCQSKSVKVGIGALISYIQSH